MGDRVGYSVVAVGRRVGYIVGDEDGPLVGFAIGDLLGLIDGEKVGRTQIPQVCGHRLWIISNMHAPESSTSKQSASPSILSATWDAVQYGRVGSVVG